MFTHKKKGKPKLYWYTVVFDRLSFRFKPLFSIFIVKIATFVVIQTTSDVNRLYSNIITESFGFYSYIRVYI